MEYKTRKYSMFSACGLNCGLCPRHHTTGTSKCPGCAGEGFSTVHPPCGVLSCSQRKGVEYCYFCDEYPCKKYEGVDLTDSFITHKNQFKDLEKAKKIGLEAYETELNRKMELLDFLLSNCDDGRRKSFYCIAVNLLELEDITSAIEKIKNETEASDSIKEKALTTIRVLQAAADKQGVSLVLRKNKK